MHVLVVALNGKGVERKVSHSLHKHINSPDLPQIFGTTRVRLPLFKVFVNLHLHLSHKTFFFLSSVFWWEKKKKKKKGKKTFALTILFETSKAHIRRYLTLVFWSCCENKPQRISHHQVYMLANTLKWI